MNDEHKAVFLSYASQDAEAAKRICDALRQAGIEVWFDQSELVGGDQWDGKIRGQIGSCSLFVPVISAATQARGEGYFRLEWKLAVDRSHLMAHDQPFLLPVVIDATAEAAARVPPEFRTVQWTKLKGGETPPAFVARVKKLLGGTVAGVADPGPAPGSASPATSGQSLSRKSPLWLIPAILGVAALTGLVFWSPWKKPVPPAPSAAPAAANLTPAQQLVAKARTILEQGDELNRETYALAEELLLKAEALDVTEASAWALHSRVSNSRIGYGMDRSAARYEALRTQTARAIQLAPDSLEAQMAECDSLISFEQNIPALINRLQALATKYPDVWRVPEMLSHCYRLLGKTQEALAANDQSLQLSPDNPRLEANRINFLVVAGRWAEAEASIDDLLQGRSGARLLAHAVYLQLMWSGDTTGAAAAVRSWPDWFLLEDRGVGHAALAALWNRDPNRALEVVRRFPRDYIRDFLFTGPSAVLSAWANEQAGNTESARADWRIVLQVTERELRSAPDDPFSLHWKAWALARLGDTPAANSILQQLLEKKSPPSAMGQIVGHLGGLALTVGRTDLALAQIALNPPGARAITKTILRLNPVFDPLRRDPRFQAVVDAALGPAEKTGVANVVPADKSVAVLAFANLSDDKANEYFSDGISEELLNVLAKVPGLKVSARTSAFYFKGKEVPIPEIAKQLGVAYVVEGSVRKAGDKVRITAQLIKAADGFHMWSDTFTRDLKDIFAVQDEIAGLIAKQLSLQLGMSSTAAAAVNPEAFELYVQARQAWNQRTLVALDRAEELLNHALALEPKFARAHAALADVWLTRAIATGKIGAFGQRNSPEFARLRVQVDRALALDSNLAEAHATLGNLLLAGGQLEEGARELRLAIKLNPNYATGHHFLGRLLQCDGRFDEARDELALAAALDPFSHRILDNYANALQNEGRFAEALAFVERALTLQPDALQSAMWKAVNLSMLGRHDEAVAFLRRQPYQNTVYVTSAVKVLVRAGLKHEAEQMLEGISGTGNYRALAALGRPFDALAAIDPTKISISTFSLVFIDPDFDPIRQDPRYVALIAELGMTEAHARARAWRAAHPLPQIPGQP